MIEEIERQSSFTELSPAISRYIAKLQGVPRPFYNTSDYGLDFLILSASDFIQNPEVDIIRSVRNIASYLERHKHHLENKYSWESFLSDEEPQSEYIFVISSMLGTEELLVTKGVESFTRVLIDKTGIDEGITYSAIGEIEKIAEEIEAGIPPDVPQDIVELAKKAIEGKRSLNKSEIKELAYRIADSVSDITD